MRRIVVALLAAVLALCLAAPAQAGKLPTQAHVRGHSIVEWQRLFLDWLTTSSENILFNGGCGEVVDGVYFMPVTTQPGLEVECDVPKGVPVLASPAGTFSEIPTWGSNDAEVQADLDATWALLLSSAVEVDGASVSLEGVGTTAGVYDVGPVEEGSYFDLICEGIPAPCKVDFAPGDTVRLASAADIVILHPFTPGTHTVYLAALFPFFPAEVTLTATLHVG
jgi:hypothetical protein